MAEKIIALKAIIIKDNRMKSQGSNAAKMKRFYNNRTISQARYRRHLTKKTLLSQ